MRQRTRLRWVPILLAIVLTLLMAASVFPTHHRQFHACVLCRLTRSDYQSIVGYRWSEIEETRCSEWYRQNIEPQHEHAWQRSPSQAGFNAFGTPVWASHSGRPAGLLLLKPEEQIRLYEHIPEPKDAARIFRGMRDDVESGDPSRYAVVRRRAGVLVRWLRSRFTREWDDVEDDLTRDGG